MKCPQCQTDISDDSQFCSRCGTPVQAADRVFFTQTRTILQPIEELAPETLLSKVWGHEYGDDVENVKRYIHYLRQKLEQDPDHPRLILTERGFGYYLAEA